MDYRIIKVNLDLLNMYKKQRDLIINSAISYQHITKAILLTDEYNSSIFFTINLVLPVISTLSTHTLPGCSWKAL